MEIWKDVKGFEDYFQVSSEGRVFSKRSNKLLKLYKHKNGYIVVSTKIGGCKGKCFCFKVQFYSGRLRVGKSPRF